MAGENLPRSTGRASNFKFDRGGMPTENGPYIGVVKNNIDPTGLGEPPFPPIFAALANALCKATGKRFYHQPFINDLNKKA